MKIILSPAKKMIVDTDNLAPVELPVYLASKEYSKCIEKYLTPQDRYITNYGSKVLYM